MATFGRVSYRSPAIDFDQPYIACLGSAHTFGRYVIKPYPEILSDLTGYQVANFGYGHSTPTKILWCKPLMNLLRKASVCVVQVLSVYDGGKEMIKLLDSLTAKKILLHFVNEPDGFPFGIDQHVLNLLKEHVDQYQMIQGGGGKDGYYPNQLVHEQAASYLAGPINVTVPTA